MSPPAAAAARSPRKRKPKAEATPAKPVDPAIAYFLDFFHRYHSTQGLRPVTLSMEPELMAISETQTTRYLWEVAVRSGEEGDEWLFIAWEIDIPGIRIRTCDSREDALEWYARREIYGPKVSTVRLRESNRPW